MRPSILLALVRDDPQRPAGRTVRTHLEYGETRHVVASLDRRANAARRGRDRAGLRPADTGVRVCLWHYLVPTAGSVPLDDRARDRLRSLGYAE